MAAEEVSAIFKSPLKYHEQYPTKLKIFARPSTIVAYTPADGNTSSGQAKDVLEDLIKTRSGLQGLVATGRFSPRIWATRHACGVHFYCRTLNLTERRHEAEDLESKRQMDELVKMIRARRASSSAERL